MRAGRSIAACSDLQRFPFLPQETHHDHIHVFAVIKGVLAEPTLLDKATGFVSTDSALVDRTGFKPDLAPVMHLEGPAYRHVDGIATITFAQIVRLVDRNAEFSDAIGPIQSVKIGITDD